MMFLPTWSMEQKIEAVRLNPGCATAEIERLSARLAGAEHILQELSVACTCECLDILDAVNDFLRGPPRSLDATNR